MFIAIVKCLIFTINFISSRIRFHIFGPSIFILSISSETMFVTCKKKKEDYWLNWWPSLFREGIKNKFSFIPCGTMSPFMSNSSKLDFASCIIVNLPEGQRDILRNQFILWLRIYDRIPDSGTVIEVGLNVTLIWLNVREFPYF